MAMDLDTLGIPNVGVDDVVPVDNGDDGNGSTLDSLIENAGDIFKGAGALISALKGNPANQQVVNNAPAPQSGMLGGISPMFMVLGVLALVVILFMVFKKK